MSYQPVPLESTRAAGKQTLILYSKCHYQLGDHKVDGEKLYGNRGTSQQKHQLMSQPAIHYLNANEKFSKCIAEWTKFNHGGGIYVINVCVHHEARLEPTK